MSNIDFTDKKTITSEFSPQEMILISRGRGKAEARKYFLTKYFVPLVTTVWFQQELTQANQPSCNLHLIPCAGRLRPHIAFESASVTENVRLSAILADTSFDQVKASIFRTCPPNLWTEPGHTMAEALADAFEDCLPEGLASLGDGALIGQCPLVAALTKSTGQGADTVTLHVLIKPLSKVRSPTSLINQGERKNSTKMAKASQKYKKMYNTITGEWHGTCDRNDADKCEHCVRIYASPAANNAYDDPELT